MLRELLLALLGYTGDLIIDVREHEKSLGVHLSPDAPISDHQFFKLAPDISFLEPSERDVIERIITLGFYYQELDRFTTMFRNLSWIRSADESPLLRTSELLKEKKEKHSVYRRAIANGIVIKKTVKWKKQQLKNRRQVKGVGEILEGLIPYSQRHFSRIDRLQRSAYLLDYTLEGMSVIEPETSEIESSKDKHVENSWGADHEQFSEEKTKEDTKEIPSKKRKSSKLEEIKSSKDKYAEISLGAETVADEKKEETKEPAKDISARKQKMKRKSGKAGNDKKVNVMSSMMSSVISAEA